MDDKLQKEYLRLFDSMDIKESSLDYSIADRHIKALKESPFLNTTAVEIGRAHV